MDRGRQGESGDRRGFGALVFVLVLLGILAAWAGSQHFVVSAARHRVRIAEAEREGIHAALAIAAQGPLLFELGAAGEEGSPEEPGDRALASRIRALLPGEVLSVDDLPIVWDPTFSALPVEVASTRLDAWFVDVRAPPGGPPPICKCGRPEDDTRTGGPRLEVTADSERARAAGVDCEAYGAFLEEFGDLPPLDTRRVLAHKKVAGDYRTIEMRGVMEFEVVVRAEVGRLPIHARARVRHPFVMRSSPCPDVEAAYEALGFGSSVTLNPIQLGRFLETWRGDAPPERETSP